MSNLDPNADQLVCLSRMHRSSGLPGKNIRKKELLVYENVAKRD